MAMGCRNQFGIPDQTCEAVATGDHGAQHVVGVVPIAEVAPERKIEDPAARIERQLLRGDAIGGADELRVPLAIHRLRSCAAVVGKEMIVRAVVIDEGRHGRQQIGDVARTDAGPSAHVAGARQRVGDPLEIVVHHRRHGHRVSLRFVTVGPGEVRAQQSPFTRAE